jgi:type I restriction enzyme R subunit
LLPCGSILFAHSGSILLTINKEYRKGADGDKETINDDIVFEIELVKQIEVNIDYILMLVAKYQQSNCKDKTILTTIDKAINSSIELRSKKELIERFIEQVNVSTKVDEDWRKFLHERKEADITAIIEEERLKPEETRRFIDNAFRDGMLKTTGTAIDKIMPPVSRFGGGRAAKKQGIIEKLMIFFEQHLGFAISSIGTIPRTSKRSGYTHSFTCNLSSSSSQVTTLCGNPTVKCFSS